MSKPKRERVLPDNEAKAVARMLRVSPQKLNLDAQLIRGRKASAALADLQFSRKRIAIDVKKCLESAIANAENNHDLEVDDLIVSEAELKAERIVADSERLLGELKARIEDVRRQKIQFEMSFKALLDSFARQLSGDEPV